MFLFPVQTFAQETIPPSQEEPTDDLGNVSDAFQENFFEALKQKGIENYELALNALDKAEAAAKGNPIQEAVVFFEKGKNYSKLRDFEPAEENFKKVLQTQPERLEVLEALYDLYYQKQDFDQAIPLVKKLIKFDEDYKEDLANLYHRTKQYELALEVLDELDDSWGESDYRDALRSRIYRVTGDTSGAIEQLEQKVDSNPKKEKEYLNLIYLYSENGETKKAFDTAKELLKNNPKSEVVHLALYKFYLDEGDTTNAIESMKRVFESTTIDKESQFKVLGDFIKFVNTHPEQEAKLESMISLFSEDDNGQVFEKVGDYYLEKNRKEEALKFYEKGISSDQDNYSLMKNTLLLQIEFKKFNEAQKLSTDALEVFPAQPLLYLLNGVARNGLQDSDSAIDSLETGIDYVFDNPAMEHDFYKQLNIAYTQKGDSTKAAQYAKKASEIKPSN
ncbi:hypothetical protein ULVI_05510 [Cochleicola gelatinilyticus]|uniref:Uncharacterized protein n=2 Tax=Cochleicola gelatinilyticus TaxID=1763537 RepID=A0A167J0F6_9FLAO|nr:hypothetical protein ULVI_05510 [Cochleicola gelatinilyticus]